MSLHEIQTKVHVGKDKENTFGGYNYRTAEGILAALKSALPDGATVIVTDTMQEVAGSIFVSAKATITLADGTAHTAEGHALHPLTKKGMDPSQITGAASSYARKYALAGLLALDDGSADPDGAKEAYQPAPPPEPTPAETRDRIKAAINGKDNTQALDALWTHSATTAAVAKLPEPMQGELQKAYTDKMGEVTPSEAA